MRVQFQKYVLNACAGKYKGDKDIPTLGELSLLLGRNELEKDETGGREIT